MRQDFTPSLAAVLLHEGGYVDDPLDNGGPTNHGITQSVYDDWRRSEGLAPRSVRSINDYETGKIYRARYWDALHGDDLPSGLDYCCFDFGVNSGPVRAARYLQQALGVAQDGQIGPQTLAAANAANALSAIDTICNARLAYLRQLPNFGRFGAGWTARVADVRAKAKAMAS